MGYSYKLNNELPKSEIWFHTYYRHFRHADDLNNLPLGGFIPDIINRKFRYVIEIDGSYHDLKEQIQQDIKKNWYYKKRGYKIIRIKAYDIESLKQGLCAVLRRRWAPYTKVLLSDPEFTFEYIPPKKVLKKIDYKLSQDTKKASQKPTKVILRKASN